MQANENKKYLKDVFPRVYAEVSNWGKKENSESVLRQLDHLLVVGRCDCGNCSNFFVESDGANSEVRPESQRVAPVVYADLEGVYLMVGLSHMSDGTVALVSFETGGYDYPDDYLDKQLEAHGWPRPQETSQET